MGKESMTSSTISVRRRKAMQARHLRRKRVIENEIIKRQKSSETIMPYASFSRVVREILSKYGNLSIRGNAMRALQYASEERITEMFLGAQRIADYTNRDTVVQADIWFTVPAEDRGVPQSVDTSEYPPPEPDQSPA